MVVCVLVLLYLDSYIIEVTVYLRLLSFVKGLPNPVDECDPGFYCKEGSNSSSPLTETEMGGPCPAGTYCVKGSTSPVSCAAGTYNSLPEQETCLDCLQGYYCDLGSTNQTICPVGTSLPFFPSLKNLTLCYRNKCDNIPLECQICQ